MSNNRRPTIEEQRGFLFKTFFGTVGTTKGGIKKDELDLFISRAYRDMNRTLRDIAKLDKERREKIFNEAKEILKKSVLALASEACPEAPAQRCQDFDKWHSDLCLKLKGHYNLELQKLGVDGVKMTYGQAQKWVNMTLKYCWVCGKADSCDLKDWFLVAHIPVDEIILCKVIEEGFVSVRPCRKWSAWDSQEAYQVFQETLRKVASELEQPKMPLELEYVLWQKSRVQEAGDEASV